MGCKKLVTLIALLTLFCSCAHVKVQGLGHTMDSVPPGKQKVVEHSQGSRPNWGIEKSFYTEGGIIYSGAVFTDAPNLAKGMEVAMKLATAHMVESIRMRLQNDVTYASQGLSIAETQLQQILNTTTDNIVTRGFAPHEKYYEKVEIKTAAGPVYRYNCYALMELSQENYLKILNSTMSKYPDEFQKKVEERQNTFLKDSGARE